ncbi:hypothetical protein sscle_04g032900 [Sclerotinia sclerotiorum 1980 UF-70]|uniref:Uncharacterized protein n=1 Tax=Sclerotinia sclerotiorum (strain ATCC 18683 / 1980 / Ss-1) TaxID=665079 RepID=A0A1D9Q0N5_SCLS1|nr:hypothetical protein sscle_04g032900 [Sclerotinia sclerotiorum 1980 UF-70]
MNGFTEDEVADELEYIGATESQEYLETIQAEDQELLAEIERDQINQTKQKNNSPATVPPQTIWGPETSPSSVSQPKQQNQNQKKNKKQDPSLNKPTPIQHPHPQKSPHQPLKKPPSKNAPSKSSPTYTPPPPQNPPTNPSIQ